MTELRKRWKKDTVSENSAKKDEKSGERQTTQRFPLNRNTHLVLRRLGAAAAAAVRTGVCLRLRGGTGQSGVRERLRVPPKL